MNTMLNTEPKSLLTSPPQSLVGLTRDQLRHVVVGMGEPAFRADQLHHWLYVKCIREYDQMTDLAKSFRVKLSNVYQPGILQIADKQISRDGTIKYLFQLPDGQRIESVLMYFQDRNTYSLCISSQVGCAVDCGFCATGKLGFKRHLSVSEIVDQYLYAQYDSGKEIRNIVFMGQGEPFLNYEPVIQAVHLLNQSAEVGIRRITLSTSGIVPKIFQLAEERIQVVLAVSLHAPDNDTRNRLMPINRKWPIETLIPVLHDYVAQTGRRVTIEYILLKGINDSRTHAHQLGRLLQDLKCNINLIPYNPIGQEYDFERPSFHMIETFNRIVAGYGKKVTTRLERGVDIAAACGQLANQYRLSEEAYADNKG